MCSSYALVFLVSLLVICHGNDIVFIFPILLNELSFWAGQCLFNEAPLHIKNGYILDSGEEIIVFFLLF